MAFCIFIIYNRQLILHFTKRIKLEVSMYVNKKNLANEFRNELIHDMINIHILFQRSTTLCNHGREVLQRALIVVQGRAGQEHT